MPAIDSRQARRQVPMSIMTSPCPCLVFVTARCQRSGPRTPRRRCSEYWCWTVGMFRDRQWLPLFGMLEPPWPKIWTRDNILARSYSHKLHPLIMYGVCCPFLFWLNIFCVLVWLIFIYCSGWLCWHWDKLSQPNANNVHNLRVVQ